ncbi:MAG: DUF134 domain-containing protein [Christensenella sp.]
MPRPTKCRRVCGLPREAAFSSVGCEHTHAITMSVEEYETIRLIDLESLTQEECALRMSVARPTVQRIYADARKKLAGFLIHGGALKIAGGDYKVCDKSGKPCCTHSCPKSQD